jgi:hypothetical protein
MLAALRPLAQQHGAGIEVIDVDAPEHAALESEWGERVPALFGGAVDAASLICFYHLDFERVAVALETAARAVPPVRVQSQNPL